MINADNYEEHTPERWTVNVHKVGDEVSAILIESDYTSHGNCVLAEVEVANEYALADAQLIADAPKLLADNRQLRAFIDKLYARDPSLVDSVWEDGDPTSGDGE